MASFRLRGSTLRGGDTLRAVMPALAVQVEYPTVTLLGVPLAVRLRTAKSDVFVSREVRDLSFRSVIPGGFASCEISLDRPLSLDPDEIQLYGELYVYDGRNGSIVWQGRLEDPGRAAGPQGEVWTVKAVGPSAHARDRTVPLIYVDQSLERYVPLFSNGTTGFIEKIADTAVSAAGFLKAGIGDGATAVVGSFVQGHQYNAIRESGQHIARFSYTWDAGVTDANWQARARMGAGDLSTLEDDIDWNTAGGSSAKVITTDYSNTFDLFSLSAERVVSNALTVGDAGWVIWSLVKIRGTLFSRTTAAEDTAGASYSLNTALASDIVADLLGRLLTEYDGVNATVTATTYAIEQLAYPDGVTPEKVLSDLMALESTFYWAAWEETTAGGDYRFEWKTWPSTIQYEASAKDGFDSPGSASDLYNAVSVRWRDILGRNRRNRRTQTVQALTDAGLTREAFIDLSDTLGGSLNADRAGDQFLLEHATPPNAGTLTVARPILDLTNGRMVHPWEIKPGGLIRVRDVKPRVDALNATARDAVTIFKVVEVDYDARNNSARLSLDSHPKTLTRLLSQMTIPDYATAGRR